MSNSFSRTTHSLRQDNGWPSNVALVIGTLLLSAAITFAVFILPSAGAN